MPTYTFECNSCNNIFEIFASYAEYSDTNNPCPKCKSKKTYRSYEIDLQNMSGSVVKSDSDIKLGDLACRNRDKMSDDQKQALYKKHNEYRDHDIKLPDGMSRIKRGPKTQWT